MRIALLTLLLAFASTQAIAKDVVAPSFTLADAQGNEVVLPGRHDGVEIYLFWASWCPYCKALMPHLQSIQVEYGDKVRIYALNIRDDDDPRKFIDKLGYDFVLLPDADPVMSLYGVKGTPGLFLIDSNGVIRFNLYEMAFADDSAYKRLNNYNKAARRAPRWAAEIRQTIDRILAATESD